MNGQTAKPWLAERLQGEADAIALVAGDAAFTWKDLALRSQAAASLLAALGVRRGDIVAAHVVPGVLVPVLLHAAQLLGAALLPLNRRLAAAELSRLLAHALPRLLVVDDGFPGGVDAAGATLVGADEVLAAKASRSFTTEPAIDPGAVLTVVYTSGTTALPKGVLLTNANHAASAAASARRLGHGSADAWLAAMPMFHVGGIAILARTALGGGRVLLDSSFDAARVAAALESGEATMVPLVPTMLARVLDAQRAPASTRLRCVLVGGAALSPSLGARALEAGLPVSTTYGMTETASQVATSFPGSDAAARGLVGPALDGFELRIADPDDAGRGEVLLRGPAVMRGYLRNAAADAASRRNGWLRTGDLGRIDADGALAIEGRIDDLVVTGGENVAPLEVERVLDAHPAVAESLVHGAADEEWGQALVADVVLRSGAGADAGELRAWCRARLAAYKIPRSFRFVTELPRGATGKVLRQRR